MPPTVRPAIQTATRLATPTWHRPPTPGARAERDAARFPTEYHRFIDSAPARPIEGMPR